MSRSRLAAVASALVLACLPATGCGGDGGADDYREKLNDIGQDFSEQVASSSMKLAGVRSPDQLSSGIETVAKDFDEAAKRLGGVDPPEKVQSQHRELVDSFGESGDVLRDTARDLEAAGGDVERIVEAQTAFSERISEQQRKLAETLEEIERELE